jgi:hypothetical protein
MRVASTWPRQAPICCPRAVEPLQNAARWQTHRTFTASLAILDGSLLGVGDRHLNNILLLRTSGDVVHVDMSVCFDQGHTLRVPGGTHPLQSADSCARSMGCAGPSRPMLGCGNSPWEQA